MNSSSSSNKRIAKNTMLLYIRMLLTMAVSLYTSRVVLNILGIENYGIYSVVGGVVAMFSFLNGAMASATQRFLSFEIGRNDFTQLRKTFNATQIIHIGIALIIFILAETIGLWFLNNYLNIPDGRMEAARWVYHFSVLTFVVTIIQVPYNAVIFARERMNVYAYVSILEVSLKLGIVFVLNWLTFDKLKLYGILVFVVSVIVASIYRIYVFKNFDESRFLVVKDKKLFRTLISFSGWNLFGGVSTIASKQGISIILNIFFGTTVNAAQGIAIQVNSAISSFVGNFQRASNPQIVKSYASNDKEYLVNLITRTSKFSFYLVYILTLPVLFEVEYILKTWLKIVPDYTAMFTILILLNSWIEAISNPLMTAVHATGKIKLYQIVMGSVIIFNLPLSYLLFKLGFTPVSTFIVNICITIIVFALRLFFAKKQISYFPISKFVKEVLLKNIPIILVSAFTLWIIKTNLNTGIFRLSLIILISLIVNALTIFTIGLTKNEKFFVKKTMLGVILKYKN